MYRYRDIDIDMDIDICRRHVNFQCMYVYVYTYIYRRQEHTGSARRMRRGHPARPEQLQEFKSRRIPQSAARFI